MKVEKSDTPEDRFGERVVPYHLTGEIRKGELYDKLTPHDVFFLGLIEQAVLNAAQDFGSTAHVLVVGSAADKTNPPYRDIDLLVCPGAGVDRNRFALGVKAKLMEDNNFFVSTHSKRSSAIFYTNLLYGFFKIFAQPKSETGQYLSNFDITFQANSGGSFEDTLYFHRNNKLAFCLLTTEK